MFDTKSAWLHATLDKRKKKTKTKNFYIIYTDLSTFSIKDNLSVFWTVNLCQLQICTGDYTMWLSELSPSATCRCSKEESVCRCTRVIDVCEYAFFQLPVHILIHPFVYKWISTTLLFQHVFENPLHGCVVQFSDLASLMLMSMASVSYIHCPSKMAAINTLALKRWLTFIQGFEIQQLLQHSWLDLLVNIGFLDRISFFLKN